VALAVVPLLAFGPAERITPTHWALIVGISDYINFGNVEGGDLPGAAHDARSMRDALITRYGFPADHVKMLLSRQATREAIKDGITKWLPEHARPGDNIVIFYAGHGSQVWDGPPTPDHPHVVAGDESDGLDETLAPADALAENDKYDIIDDELNRWLGMLPTNNVVVILDNCNSGTGTRDVTPFSRARRLARDLSKLPKPPGFSTRGIKSSTDQTGMSDGRVHVLELAASQPDQSAVDAYFPGADGSPSFHGGAFTTFLVRSMWRAPAGASYEQVFKTAQEAMKRDRFQQDPEISQDVTLKDSPLFYVEGGSSGAAYATLPVRSVHGSTAEIDGGLALGITKGSVFETPAGARLVVQTVDPDSSSVKVASGSVTNGDMARLTGYRYSESPLRVNVSGIDSESTAALARELQGFNAIQLVTQPDAFAHLLVRRRGTDLRVIGADGFVRHDGIPSGIKGASQLAGYLKQEAAAKRLADMENPAQSFGVKLSLAGGKTSFGIGEDISFKATSERDGYLTLLDLGTDGKVVMLFPNAEHKSAPIKAGQTLTFPTPDMGFQLQIFPPAGRGMVRAFVTPRPLDLPIPADGSYAEGDASFAAEVARAVEKAAGTVDGAPGAVRLDTWSTASLVYDIHD
jgi:hypothetical protein